MSHVAHQELREKIIAYFPAESLSYFPENTLEYLLSGEIIFGHLIEGENIDSSAMIFEYQKALDEMLELYVVQPFRHEFRLQYSGGIPIHNTASHLEKSLCLVVEKNYRLSFGRFYEVLGRISEISKNIGVYESGLRDFLTVGTLEKILVKSHFGKHLASLIESGVMNEKRHSGVLSFDEALKARKSICGNFENPDSLLYLLASTQIL